MAEKTGACAYCGQTMMIETVGELSQEEIDMMVTDKCKCPQASEERRKKERKEKIDKFVKRNFEPDIAMFIKNVIRMIEEQDLSDFVIKLPDDRAVKIWLDYDYFLHIKVKKNLDEELKV